MLGYGPTSVTTLSPPTVIMRIGYGSPLGRLKVQTWRSAVAVSTQVENTLSLGPALDLPTQVPATSESLIPPPCASTGLRTAPLMQPPRLTTQHPTTRAPKTKSAHVTDKSDQA